MVGFYPAVFHVVISFFGVLALFIQKDSVGATDAASVRLSCWRKFHESSFGEIERGNISNVVYENITQWFKENFNLLIEKYRIMNYIMIRCRKIFLGGKIMEKYEIFIARRNRNKETILKICDLFDKYNISY